LIEEPIPVKKAVSASAKSTAMVLDQIDLVSPSVAEKYIPNARFLNNKVVVLLLEVSLIDQKNVQKRIVMIKESDWNSI